MLCNRSCIPRIYLALYIFILVLRLHWRWWRWFRIMTGRLSLLLGLLFSNGCEICRHSERERPETDTEHGSELVGRTGDTTHTTCCSQPTILGGKIAKKLLISCRFWASTDIIRKHVSFYFCSSFYFDRQKLRKNVSLPSCNVATCRGGIFSLVKSQSVFLVVHFRVFSSLFSCGPASSAAVSCQLCRYHCSCAKRGRGCCECSSTPTIIGHRSTATNCCCR